MLGDHEQSLTPGCHAQIEAEANYAAGQLLFLQSRFRNAANDSSPSIESIRALKGDFGNTYTTTFWRFIEDSHRDLPMIGLIGTHPRFPKATEKYFRHVIESPAYKLQFESLPVEQLRQTLLTYCQFRKAGPLGSNEVLIKDRRGEPHIFLFETFSNTYDCLTLATYRRAHVSIVNVSGDTRRTGVARPRSLFLR